MSTSATNTTGASSESKIHDELCALERLVRDQTEQLTDLHASIELMQQRLHMTESPEQKGDEAAGRHKQHPNTGLMKDLRLLIIKREPYLKDSTSMHDIAACMKITQKQLRDVLENSEYGSLNNLMNHHRILAACQLMQMQPEFTVEAISDESGFRSPKSFYRWFQREMGITPTEYKHRLVNPIK